MRVTIEVTEAQAAELKRQAGLVPLSRWIRAQLFSISDEDRAKELIPLLKKSIAKSEAVAKRKPSFVAADSYNDDDVKAADAINGIARILPPVDMRKILP